MNFIVAATNTPMDRSFRFPNSEMQKGRIDFYIPSKKWGIKILREGDRLENHSSRFRGQGAYVNMQFDDYINMLDFRTTTPQVAHPSQSMLNSVSFYPF
jgi:hypothetical protein